ncbi:MAG: phasin family protein [Burkholderiaceae bacterium]
MVTKLHKTKSAASNETPMSGSIKDSAQQIWQAGLGAFAKAQAEGTRAFEALVKEGSALQRKTQTAAEERISDATERMTHMASDIGSKASGHWDKLENIFEQRVAKALNTLGVPSAKDVKVLIARIDELTLSVQKLSGDTPASAAKASAKRSKGQAATASRKGAAPTKVAAPAKPAAKPRAKAAAKPAAKAAATATANTVKTRTADKRKPAAS